MWQEDGALSELKTAYESGGPGLGLPFLGLFGGIRPPKNLVGGYGFACLSGMRNQNPPVYDATHPNFSFLGTVFMA